MAKVRWKFNLEGFAALRNDPSLVSRMETAAESAAAGTPFEVQVETFPHQGRRSGARTSVQIWASSFEARAAVNRGPEALTATLNRVRI